MEAVLVALIVAGVGVFGQYLLRRQDFARQDQVAEQAAKAAELLRTRQDQVAAQAAEAARLLLEANERVAEQSAQAFAATQRQLGQIHTLVNSNLTEAQGRELEATRAMLVTMQEVVDLKRQRGVEPSQEAIDAIAATRSRVEALSQSLAQKAEQTKVADAKAAE
jgi:hypothetical protein